MPVFILIPSFIIIISESHFLPPASIVVFGCRAAPKYRIPACSALHSTKYGLSFWLSFLLVFADALATLPPPLVRTVPPPSWAWGSSVPSPLTFCSAPLCRRCRPTPGSAPPSPSSRSSTRPRLPRRPPPNPPLQCAAVLQRRLNLQPVMFFNQSCQWGQCGRSCRAVFLYCCTQPEIPSTLISLCQKNNKSSMSISRYGHGHCRWRINSGVRDSLLQSPCGEACDSVDPLRETTGVPTGEGRRECPLQGRRLRGGN